MRLQVYVTLLFVWQTLYIALYVYNLVFIENYKRYHIQCGKKANELNYLRYYNCNVQYSKTH